MKEYAKYCKIKIENTKYQLNLTEGGVDTAHFLGRAFTIIRLIPPAIFSFVVLKNIFTFALFNYYTPSDVSYLISSGILTCGFSLPHTNLGNAFNAILKCFSLKRKRIQYYSKMRSFEKDKFKINNKPKKVERLLKYQSRITKELIEYFERETRKFKNLTKRYYKKENRKGYIDGLAGFALDNLEMHQEEIDKMIFHNIGLFKKLCPDKEEFLMNRFEKRYNDIINNEPNYDEFIYSATHENYIIKNDCIDKTESSDYLHKLLISLNLKKEIDPTNINPTSLENANDSLIVQPNKIREDINKNNNRIYVSEENEK